MSPAELSLSPRRQVVTARPQSPTFTPARLSYRERYELEHTYARYGTQHNIILTCRTLRVYRVHCSVRGGRHIRERPPLVPASPQQTDQAVQYESDFEAAQEADQEVGRPRQEEYDDSFIIDDDGANKVENFLFFGFLRCTVLPQDGDLTGSDVSVASVLDSNSIPDSKVSEASDASL